MSRVVLGIAVFMIVSPRLVNELILIRREQALKGCSGLSFFVSTITENSVWGDFFMPSPLTKKFSCEIKSRCLKIIFSRRMTVMELISGHYYPTYLLVGF